MQNLFKLINKEMKPVILVYNQLNKTIKNAKISINSITKIIYLK